MKAVKKLTSLFLAILMTAACIPAAAVSPRWYDDEGAPVYSGEGYLKDLVRWPEPLYVQAGFFEYVETEWGNYYNRLDKAEVELPADSLRIRYIADMSAPISNHLYEEWDYEDAQYGTVDGIQTLPSFYKATYLHLYCEGDPNDGGQPTWLGECIPIGMDPDEWRARVIADLLPKFDEWRAETIERDNIPEEDQYMIDLNMFMMEKEGGWDWEAFLDAQPDVKFTSDPNLPLMTDNMLTGGHGKDVYSDRYYVTLVRISHAGNVLPEDERLLHVLDHSGLGIINYTSSPYQGEYFVDFSGPNSAPFQENTNNDTLEVKVVDALGAQITDGIGYKWTDRTYTDDFVFSRESTLPFAGASTWSCELTFDSYMKETYIVGDTMTVDFLPGEYKPRTVTLVPKRTYTIRGQMAESIPGVALTFTIHEPDQDRQVRPAMTDGEFSIEARCYPVDMEITAPGYRPYRVRDIFANCPMEHGVADLGVIEMETDDTIHALKVKTVDENDAPITKEIAYRWYKTDDPETTLSTADHYLPSGHGNHSCEMTFSNELCLLYDVSTNTYTVDFPDGGETTEKTVYLTKRVYTVTGSVTPVSAKVFYIVGEDMDAEPVMVETDENGGFAFSLTKDLVYLAVTLEGFTPFTISDLFRFCRADEEDRIDLGEMELVNAPRPPLVVTVVDTEGTRILEGISYCWRLVGDETTRGTESMFVPDHDSCWTCEMTFSQELYETYTVPGIYYVTFDIGDIMPRTITLTPRKTYTITGKVTTPGAAVTVTSPEFAGDRVIPLTPDANGVFSVEVPDYDRTRVEVSAPGYRSYTNSDVFIYNVPDANGVSDLGEIDLERILHFEVLVTDENDVPITDGIGYYWYDTAYPNIAGSGRYYFDPSAKADFRCRLSFSDELQEQYKISGEITLPFNMDTDFVRTVKLETRKTYTVSGMVKTSDADVTMIVSEVTGDRELKPTPDANGRFSVTVKDYPVSVSVVKPSHKPYYKEKIFDAYVPDASGNVDLGEITLTEMEFNVAYPFTLDTSADPTFRINDHTLTLYVYREGEPMQTFSDVSIRGDYVIIGDEAAAQLKDGDLIGLTIAEFDVAYPLYAKTTFYVYVRRESETVGTIALEVEKKGKIQFLRDSTNPEKIGIALFSGAYLAADGLIVEPQTDAEALADNTVNYYMPEDDVNDLSIVCWSGAEGEWERLVDYDRIIDLPYNHYFAAARVEKDVPLIVDLADVPKKPEEVIIYEMYYGDFTYTFGIDEENVTPETVPIVFQYSGAGTEEDEKEFIFVKLDTDETLGAGFMPLYGSVYVKDLETGEEIDAQVIGYMGYPALKFTTHNTSGTLYFELRSVGGTLYFGSYRFTNSELKRVGMGTIALPKAQSVAFSLPNYTTTKNMAMELTVILPNIEKKTYTASIYVNDEKAFEMNIKKGSYRLPFTLPVKNQVDIFKVKLIITVGSGEEFFDSGDKKLTYYPASVPLPKKLDFTLTNKNITNTSGVALEKFNGVKRVSTGSVDYETGKKVDPKFTVPDYNIGKNGTMKYDVVYDFELTFANVNNLNEDSVKLLVDCDTAGVKTVSLKPNSRGIFTGTLTLKGNNYDTTQLPQSISVDFEYDESVDPAILQSDSVISDYLTEAVAAYKKQLEEINNTVFYEALTPIDLSLLEEALTYELDDEDEEEIPESLKNIILDLARDYNEAAKTQELYLDELTDTVEDVIRHDFKETKGEELEPAFSYDPAPDDGKVSVLNPPDMKDEHGDSTLLQWEVDTGTANAYLNDPNYEKDSYEIDGETVTFLRRKTISGGDSVYKPATVIIESNGNVILGYEPSEEEEATATVQINYEADHIPHRSADDIYHFELPQTYYDIGKTISTVISWSDQMLKLVNNVVDEILRENITPMKATEEELQKALDRGTVKERSLRTAILKLKGNDKIRLSDQAQEFFEAFLDKDMKVSDLEKELQNIKKAISTTRSQLALLKDIKSIQEGTAAGTINSVSKSAKAMKTEARGPVSKLWNKLTKPIAIVDVIVTPLLALTDICNEYQTLCNKVNSREKQIAWALMQYMNAGDYREESECSRAVNEYINMLERETVEDVTMLVNTGLVSLVGTVSSVMGAISAFLPEGAKKLNKVSDVLSVFSFTMGEMNSFLHSGIQALEIAVSSEAEREQLICDKCAYDNLMRVYYHGWMTMYHAYYECFTVIDHKLVYDPAGYVYEAVASNRVEGATVKAYFEGDDGEPVFWNAEEYDEVNPQITDKYGEYSWMTPQGNWYVTAEKEGYVTGDSREDPAAVNGWLPVLPPQVNVNIPLVSTAAPTVESAAAAQDQIQISFRKYMDEAYLLSNASSLITVTENGVPVSVNAAFSDREVDPRQSGVWYGRNLVLTKASGEDFSGEIRVAIGGAVQSYAGTAMGTDYDSGALSVEQIPGEIEHSYPNRLVLMKGEPFTVSVRLADTVGQPIAGETVTLSKLDGTILDVPVSAITDENGVASFTLDALIPGNEDITFKAGNVEKILHVGVSDPEDGDTVPAKPTANLSDYQTVTAGTKLELSTVTEGAKIFYTLNNTCPCTESPDRYEYTGPIEITEDGYFRIAAWTEGGGYSERLNLHLYAAEAEFGTPEYSWDGQNCTATRICLTDDRIKETETVTGVYVKDTDASCTENEKGHYEAAFTNSAFAKQSTASESAEKPSSALGHDYGTPTYEWNGQNCTAARICRNNAEHIETETVTGVYVKDADATGTEAEKGHYEAMFTNSAFTKQSTVPGSTPEARKAEAKAEVRAAVPAWAEGRAITESGLEAAYAVIDAAEPSDDMKAVMENAIAVLKAILESGRISVTVTADSLFKTYGESDPTLTYTASGLETGDTLTDIIVTRISGEDAGEYTVTASMTDPDANPKYIISFVNGTFTVNKANAVCTGAPAARTEFTCGTSSELLIAGTAEGGTFAYSLDGTGYSEAIPTVSGLGAYTVWYKVIGDSNHNDSDPVSIPVTVTVYAHTFMNYVYDGNGTCKKNGTKTARCENCSATDTVTAPGTATGHRFARFRSNGDATCTEDGTMTAYCAYGCGTKYTMTDAGSALGHNYVSTVVAPTASARGYTLHTCARCGDSYKDDYTEPAVTVLPGDFNGDGKVNGKDLIVLRNYLSGAEDPAIILTAYDMNGDGKINGKDLSLLRKYLAGA